MAERRRARPARRRRRISRLVRLPRWAWLLVVLVAVVVGGYFLWFKGSSLVAVEDVRITGVDVSPGVAATLENTAVGMSTLDLDREALEAVVADDPSVVGLKMETDFPHGLTIDVASRRPVGWWAAGGGTVVAGDGIVLDSGTDRPQGLPLVEAEEASPVAERVEGPALALAKVLGGAPQPLLEQTERGWVDGERGPIVELRGGIELRFGDPSNAASKWKAAAAVLADPELTSAQYLDLSVPSRPVVG